MLSPTTSLLWTTFSFAKTLWSLFYSKTICSFIPYARNTAPKARHRPKALASEDVLAQIKAIREDHETAGLLQQLIEIVGAGQWPPQPSHGDSWPEVLRPYHAIYVQLAPLLPAKTVSLDAEVNRKRRLKFQTRMRKLLHDHVDLLAVKALLSASEAGDISAIPSDVYHGFYSCITMSRHAFRWATIPVVKVAQEEKFIDLPPELEMPWPFLRRHYGVTSQGGNVMSNFFYNFDKEDRLVYEINCGMSEVIRSAEYNFAHIFPQMESLALPIYHNIVKSIICFEQGRRDKCLEYVKAIGSHVRIPLKVYYDTQVETKISKSVWMSYVQGFHGWSAGEIKDGVYVEYDGLSGNQLPFFHIVDAFLGLDQYLKEEDMQRYIPKAQRELSICIKEHSFRHKSKLAGDVEMETEMENIVKQMRLFRVAHRNRAHQYLSAPAPERMIMTAGKSVLESSTIKNIKAALLFLDEMMVRRLKATA